jgi:hypothetical protein
MMRGYMGIVRNRHGMYQARNKVPKRLGLRAKQLYVEIYGKKPNMVRSSTKPASVNAGVSPWLLRAAIRLGLLRDRLDQLHV